MGTPLRNFLPTRVKTNFGRLPTHPPTSFTPQNFKNRINQKNDKIGKTQNRNFGKTKNWKCVKKMFLTKFWTKNIFGRRNLSFQSLPGHQNIKIRAVNNVAMSQRPKKPKHGDLFSHFSVPGRTIRGHRWIDLDLSCSELFFRVPCDSYSVPNDLIRFFNFGRFFRFFNFDSFSNFDVLTIFRYFWIYEELIFG